MSFPWSPFDFGPFDSGVTPPAPVIEFTGQPGPVTYRPGAIFRDFALGADGKWDLSRGDTAYAADETAIAQQIQLRLQTQKGERIDDLDLGVDLSRVFGVGRTQGQICAAFRGEILSVPGVREVTSLTAKVEGGTCTVQWTATTDLNQLVSGQTLVNGGG